MILEGSKFLSPSIFLSLNYTVERVSRLPGAEPSASLPFGRHGPVGWRQGDRAQVDGLPAPFVRGQQEGMLTRSLHRNHSEPNGLIVVIPAGGRNGTGNRLLAKRKR